MSWKAEDIEQDLTVKELLEVIARELMLLNARIEASFETGIEKEDIE